MQPSRISLRGELQRRRSEISDSEQANAASALVESVLRKSPTAIGIAAGYIAHGGEIDPMPALEALRGNGWEIVLPICGADAAMDFSPWAPGEALHLNRYGIGEPDPNPVPIDAIEMVLVPGVGFDTAGSRIGHGVGFYDRFFARCFAVDHDPLRLALAHDLQVVDLPEPEEWDVAMHALITPSQVIDTGRCA